MVPRRHVLTNPIWQELEPLVPASKRSKEGAPPDLSDRNFLEAEIHFWRTGIPWRDLPEEFGDWNAVYQRFKRWRIAGVRDRLFGSLPVESPVMEAQRLFIDSTSIRAHQHAAGAQKK